MNKYYYIKGRAGTLWDFDMGWGIWFSSYDDAAQTIREIEDTLNGMDHTLHVFESDVLLNESD